MPSSTGSAAPKVTRSSEQQNPERRHMKRILILVAVAAAAAGCSTPQTQTESNYGKAVRDMISAQVADPTTLTNPSTAPVTGADPDMVNAAVNALRGEVSKPEDVKRDIVLKVGGK